MNRARRLSLRDYLKRRSLHARKLRQNRDVTTGSGQNRKGSVCPVPVASSGLLGCAFDLVQRYVSTIPGWARRWGVYCRDGFVSSRLSGECYEDSRAREPRAASATWWRPSQLGLRSETK